MSAGQANFEVARPTGVCAATGEPIRPGDRFIATLVEHAEEDQRLERMDFSLRAWQGGARPQRPLALVGHWKTVMPERDAPKRLLIGDEALLDFFEQLAEATEPKRRALRFILALILIRKRLLRLEGSKGGTMLLRPKGVELPPERGGEGPPLLEVEDPGLDEHAIAEVTEELGAILNLDDDDKGDA